MKKASFFTAFLLLIFATAGLASQIPKITLSELQAKADLIVIAQVTEVIAEGNQDRVTIAVDSFLKGSGSGNAYTFILVSRGGLKDFDPCLKKGDAGVFFLKRAGNDQVEKAYWGSVAVFPKNHFLLTETATSRSSADIRYAEFYEAWRSYRVEHGQACNMKEYEQGFQKGFAGPPGLVDGSADFNLGHSDGMLSKMNVLPDGTDTGKGN